MGEKLLRIKFNETDGFIKINDGIMYLILFTYGLYDASYNKLTYLISEKSEITDSINHNFARIGIGSHNSLPIEKKTLTFHNVIILIKLVANKNKNNYYYNIFLEKVSIKINPIHNIFK